MNLFQESISKPTRTIKVPDKVSFYELDNGYSINDFTGYVINEILEDETKELKFGTFTNSRVPKHLKYATSNLTSEEKQEVIANKTYVDNNFRCYLLPTNYGNLHKQQFVYILTTDNITYYCVEVSWLDIIRDMDRVDGSYSIDNNLVEGDFRYCLFDGKDYRLLSEYSKAYRDIEDEILNRG